MQLASVQIHGSVQFGTVPTVRPMPFCIGIVAFAGEGIL
jgi:hypothetical protein